MRFPNIAGSNPGNDRRCIMELTDAGINVDENSCYLKTAGEVKTSIRGELHGWSFERYWVYWVCRGPGIPVNAAMALYLGTAGTVRVDGHCGNLDPLETYKGLGVGYYHVDDQDGLNALAETIRMVVRMSDGSMDHLNSYTGAPNARPSSPG